MTNQNWDAAAYAERVGFVSELGKPVLDLLGASPGERVLDLGCGDGTLAAELVQRGVFVVGIDGSPNMVRAAIGRGVDARLMDGHQLSFTREFDAVFSNAALHWMTRPDEVLAGVARALRPAGRFVGEFGGHANVAAIVTALVAARQEMATAEELTLPWYFPTADEYAERLLAHGFEVESIALIPRPTPLDAGMQGWLATFAGPFLHGMEPDQRETYLTRVVSLLEHSLRDRHGNWTADYVRLRFRASLGPSA